MDGRQSHRYNSSFYEAQASPHYRVQQQQHQHLIQSPYKVPVLPQLHPTEEVRRSQGEGARYSTSNHRSQQQSDPNSQALRPSISSPVPLKQWPYVQPVDPSHPWDPSALQTSNATVSSPLPLPQPASHDITHSSMHNYQSPATVYDPRHGSVSTADSSGTGEDSQDRERNHKKKKPSKFKSKVKALFAKDEYDEPTKPVRRPSNPWEDEDY